MLAEALTFLAASCGTAVVQAAGTDAWAGLRRRLASALGQGDDQREHAELERLDQTAVALDTASVDEVDLVRARQAGAWQARFEHMLASAEGAEQVHLTEALQQALADAALSQAGNDQVWHGAVRMTAEASDQARVYQVGQGEMRVSDS